MRLCRYHHQKTTEIALFLDDRVVCVNRAATALDIRMPTPDSVNILDYLAPHGRSAKAAALVAKKFDRLAATEQRRLSQPLHENRLRVPHR